MEIETIKTLAEAVFFVFSLGVVYAGIQGTLKNLAASVKRLEEKQEKYNNLQERVLRNELKIETFDREIAELKGQK